MARRRSTEPLIYEPPVQSRPGLTRVDIHKVAFIAVMLALIGLAAWLYLYETSEVASCARQIKDLEQERERLHREIIVLRGKVARLGSLQRVLQVGEQLGYRLPEASDASHRLCVAYEPPPQVTPQPSQVPMERNLTAGESGSGQEGLLQKLLTEMGEWIASSPAGAK